MPNTSTRKKTVSKTPIDPSFGHLQPQALDIEKAVEVEEKLFGDCFESYDQTEGMANFLRKKDDPAKVKVVAFQNK